MKKNATRFLNYVMCILVSIVFISVIVKSVITSFGVLIFTGIFLAIALTWINIVGNVENGIYIGLMAIGVLFSQVFISKSMMVEYSTWDVYNVTESARAIVEGGAFDYEYFARYPQNMGILVLYTLIYKVSFSVFGSTSILWLIVWNILSVDMTIVGEFVLLREFVSCRAGVIALVISALFSPFYLYLPICYTDLVSMPFFVWGIYAFLCFDRNEKLFNYMWAMILFLGYKLKGSGIILFIAVLFYLFMTKSLREAMRTFIIATLFWGILICAWSKMEGSLNWITQEAKDEYRIPTLHWIEMGLEGQGNFDAESLAFTDSIEGYEGKKEAVKLKLKERASELGIAGVIKQYYNKSTDYCWNFGTCYAERYLGDIGDKPANYNVLHEVVLTKGRYHHIFYVFTQAFYVVLIIFTIYGFIHETFDKNTRELLIIRLIICGAICFLMIWETHPRYTLNFMPFIIIMASSVLDKITNKEKK